MQKVKLRLKDKIQIIFLFVGLLSAVFPKVTVYIPAVVLSNLGLFGWCFYTLIFDKKSRYIFARGRNLCPIILLVAMYFVSGMFGNFILGNRYMDLSVTFLHQQ